MKLGQSCKQNKKKKKKTQSEKLMLESKVATCVGVPECSCYNSPLSYIYIYIIVQRQMDLHQFRYFPSYKLIIYTLKS